MNDKSLDSGSKSTGAIPKLAETMETLLLATPNSSDDQINGVEWFRARDSLESLLCAKGEKAGVDVSNSKSMSCTSSSDKEKCLMLGSDLSSASPHSESVLGSTTKTSSSVAKVLSWDPWDKLGRKSKKENKRRKHEKPSPLPLNKDPGAPQQHHDHKSGDGGETLPRIDPAASATADLNYEYQPYHSPKNTRSVEFTNKVMVVYIKEDRVIGETTEPLKKEQEQQIRNKEMRKGHMPDIAAFGAANANGPGKQRRLANDWFRK